LAQEPRPLKLGRCSICFDARMAFRSALLVLLLAAAQPAESVAVSSSFFGGGVWSTLSSFFESAPVEQAKPVAHVKKMNNMQRLALKTQEERAKRVDISGMWKTLEDEDRMKVIDVKRKEQAIAAKAKIVAKPVKVQKKAPTKLDQKAEDFWGALQEEDNKIESHAIEMEAKENMVRQQGGVFAMRR